MLKEIIEKSKLYYIVISSFVVAILLVYIQRRNSSIKDIQAELIRSKIDAKLQEAVKTKSQTKEAYAEAIHRYNELLDKYSKLLS